MIKKNILPVLICVSLNIPAVSSVYADYGSSATNQNGTVSIMTSGHTESVSVGQSDTDEKSNSKDSDQGSEDNSQKNEKDSGAWDSYGTMPKSMFPYGNSGSKSSDEMEEFSYPSGDYASKKLPADVFNSLDDLNSLYSDIFDSIPKNDEFTMNDGKGIKGEGTMDRGDAEDALDDYRKALNIMSKDPNRFVTEIPVGAKRLKKGKLKKEDENALIKKLKGPKKTNGKGKKKKLVGTVKTKKFKFIYQTVSYQPPVTGNYWMPLKNNNTILQTTGNLALDREHMNTYLAVKSRVYSIDDDILGSRQTNITFKRIYKVKTSKKTINIYEFVKSAKKLGLIKEGKDGLIDPGPATHKDKIDAKDLVGDDKAVADAFNDGYDITSLIDQFNKQEQDIGGNNNHDDYSAPDTSGKRVRDDLKDGGYTEPLTLADTLNDGYGIYKNILGDDDQSDGDKTGNEKSGKDSETEETGEKGKNGKNGESKKDGDSHSVNGDTNSFDGVESLIAISDVHISTTNTNATTLNKFLNDKGQPSYRYTIWEKTADGKKGKKISNSVTSVNGKWKDGYFYSNANSSDLTGLPAGGCYIKTEQEYSVSKGLTATAQRTDYLIDKKTGLILWMRSNGFEDVSDTKNEEKTKWLDLGTIQTDDQNQNSGNPAIERVE